MYSSLKNVLPEVFKYLELSQSLNNFVDSQEQMHRHRIHLNKSSFVLQGYFYLFKMFGINPCSIKSSIIFRKRGTSHTKSTYSLILSYFGIIYNFVLLFLLVLANWHGIVFMMSFQRVGSFSYKLPQLIGSFLFFFGAVTISTIWLIYVLRLAITLRIANKFTYLEVLMMKYDTENVKTGYSFILMFIGNLMTNSYTVWYSIRILYKMGIDIVSAACIFSMSIIPSIILSWFIIQYAMIVRLIKFNFEIIHNELRKLGNVPTGCKMEFSLMRKQVLTRTMNVDIVELRRMHREFSGICEQVSDCYGFPMLLCILYFSMFSVSNSYYVVVPFISPSLVELYVPQSIAMAWLVLYMSCLAYLTTGVSGIIEEMKQTARIVHRLMDKCSLDSEVLSELKEFSWELLHRNVQFDVCGIFFLDNSLIHSISGMVITYLIIFIQFVLK